MKILIMTSEFDLTFNYLVESLNYLKYQIGHIQHPAEQKVVEEFNPEIIIHNIKDVANVAFKDCITISINELNENNCFSLRDPSSENFIKPFIKKNPHNLFDEKYKSDVVHIGGVDDLPECFAEVAQNKKINTKIVHNVPIPSVNYVGNAYFTNHGKFFHMAKCSIADDQDSNVDTCSYKLLEILASDGNPIIHHSDEQFINDVNEAVFENKSFKHNFITKEEIFNKHTNHDRMSKIFSMVGLNKISKILLDSKGR